MKPILANSAEELITIIVLTVVICFYFFKTVPFRKQRELQEHDLNKIIKKRKEWIENSFEENLCSLAGKYEKNIQNEKEMNYTEEEVLRSRKNSLRNIAKSRLNEFQKTSSYVINSNIRASVNWESNTDVVRRLDELDSFIQYKNS
tara:strand:- start:218 stop:655 length:438 start_codon:yes stop_codon:yes gene_type:complete